jgi:hypothetical protein
MPALQMTGSTCQWTSFALQRWRCISGPLALTEDGWVHIT